MECGDLVIDSQGEVGSEKFRSNYKSSETECAFSGLFGPRLTKTQLTPTVKIIGRERVQLIDIIESIVPEIKLRSLMKERSLGDQ